MSRYLSVSRAARLVGITRGALQKQIRAGELQSFEGKVRLEELAELYPDIDTEDRAITERLEQIIENALQRARYGKLEKLLLPDPDVLVARLHALSAELDALHQQSHRDQASLEELRTAILDIPTTAGPQQTEMLLALQQRLQQTPPTATPVNSPRHLTTADTLLRVMAAQVQVQPQGEEFFIEGNKSILESALSAGIALSYACSHGNCGECKARLISGELQPTRAHDYVLTPLEKQQNYFLTCCHTAISDVVIEAGIAGSAADIPPQTISAWVRSFQPINNGVYELRLKTPRTQRLRFLAGQAINVQLSDTHQQELAIASCPCDDMNIEFHIPARRGNDFFDYLDTQLQNNDSVTLQGPQGEFILDYHDTRPILFIAVDAYFAAIKSLIEHALTLEAAEHLRLLWLTSTPENHYQPNLCRAWDDAFDNFSYTLTPLTSAETITAGLTSALAKEGQLHRSLLYVSTPPEWLAQIKQALLELGLSEEQCHFNTLC